jgi:3-isopropylmalate/(R)-2-methylmalate dehydratase small subunit
VSGRPLTRLTAVAAPLVRDDINTDVIIPSREMKTVSRRGLSDGLFADWRYASTRGREPNPAFVLNDPRYAGAEILLTGANFGCGSSREHAAWALVEYGFRAIVAESFNPIFRNNAVLNGLAPIVLSESDIAALADDIAPDPQSRRLTVDLTDQTVTSPNGAAIAFELDDEAREMLIEGLDGIDLTLKHHAEIAAFRAADRAARPWAYP